MECVWWWLELGVIVSLLGHFQPFGMYNCMEVGSEKEGIWRRKRKEYRVACKLLVTQLIEDSNSNSNSNSKTSQK